MSEFPDKFAWQAVNTGDFRRAAEEIFGSDLQYFFIEWIESSGAPEFKLDYTIFRTQKNFRIVGKVSQDMDTFRMPVELKIETDGNPEEKRVEVVGTSSEFSVETFGRPRTVTLDPNNRLLRYSSSMRVAVAIRRGEMFVEAGDFAEALKEYQRALDVNRNSSLAHYRIGEVFFMQDNYQSAANAFREALNGDLEPEVGRSVGPHQPGQDLRHHRPARARPQRIPARHPHQGQHARRPGRGGQVHRQGLPAPVEGRPVALTPRKQFFFLLAIAALALLVHGYHYGIEDEAIYLPAVKQHLNGSLYPFDSAFFDAQCKLTLFDEFMALVGYGDTLAFGLGIFRGLLPFHVPSRAGAAATRREVLPAGAGTLGSGAAAYGVIDPAGGRNRPVYHGPAPAPAELVHDCVAVRGCGGSGQAARHRMRPGCAGGPVSPSDGAIWGFARSHAGMAVVPFAPGRVGGSRSPGVVLPAAGARRMGESRSALLLPVVVGLV